MTDIYLAPFSNSVIRDWPESHYRRLIGLLVDEPAITGRIHVIGAAGQRLRACEIVRPYDNRRVANQCGRIDWADLLNALSRAGCVVGNNSGIAHIAGAFGTPTVCVFGGSHQRFEWRPRGRRVVLVSRAIGCSPCQLDHGDTSLYDKACLRDIAPTSVRDAMIAAMQGLGGRSPDQHGEPE